MSTNYLSVDIQLLHTKETWNVDTNDEQGATTLLVSTFLLIRYSNFPIG